MSLIPQGTNDSKRPVSDLSETGAPDEIEVTTAMIEAGVRKFYANLSEDPNPSEAREAVREIFTAMSQASCL
jgi:hypothetical protein